MHKYVKFHSKNTLPLTIYIYIHTYIYIYTYILVAIKCPLFLLITIFNIRNQQNTTKTIFMFSVNTYIKQQQTTTKYS